MDAQAYLRKQGWRGDGHSLDHTGKGIKKPLLVSKKVDVLGVGINKHTAVSDQWWMRAFDEGLKNLGSGKESTLGQVQKHGVARGGLYGRFVKGEGVPGTFGDGSVSGSGVTTPVDSGVETIGASNMGDSAPEKGGSKKRKRGDESRDQKHARRKTKQLEKTVSLQNRPEKTHRSSQASSDDEAERKHRKELRRRVNGVVLRAQYEGIIPTDPDELQNIRSKAVKAAPLPTDPEHPIAQLIASKKFRTLQELALGGPDGIWDDARQKMKRWLKRTAKAYFRDMAETTGRLQNKPAGRARSMSGAAAEEKAGARSSVDITGRKEQAQGLAAAGAVDSTVETGTIVPDIRKFDAEKAAKKGLSMEEYATKKQRRLAKKNAKDAVK